MKERPILFSGKMVRAILEGRKTQTRRVVMPVPPAPTVDLVNICDNLWACIGNNGPNRTCRYGQTGDRLWVRERHALVADGPLGIIPGVVYHADGQARWNVPMKDGLMVYNYEKPDIWKWRPSIHTRREHSRITLEITGVRVDRLQEITEADAIAEGIEPVVQMGTYKTFTNYAPGLPAHLLARDSYRPLWDSLNAKRGFGWDSNPWVWVIEFKKLETKEELAA